MKKQEYRYQFIRFEDVKTGKFIMEKRFGLGFGMVSDGNPKADSVAVPVVEEVAVVFDKQKGIIKQEKIKKLYETT